VKENNDNINNFHTYYVTNIFEVAIGKQRSWWVPDKTIRMNK